MSAIYLPAGDAGYLGDSGYGYGYALSPQNGSSAPQSVVMTGVPQGYVIGAAPGATLVVPRGYALSSPSGDQPLGPPGTVTEASVASITDPSWQPVYPGGPPAVVYQQPPYGYGSPIPGTPVVYSGGDVTQTYINPVSRVSEVRIQEVLPVVLSELKLPQSPVVIRSFVADRGQIARQMLVVWPSQAERYGVDTNVVTDPSLQPQVYLFSSAGAREQYQKQLAQTVPQLNLMAYRLDGGNFPPVRIQTNYLPGAQQIPTPAFVLSSFSQDPLTGVTTVSAPYGSAAGLIPDGLSGVWQGNVGSPVVAPLAQWTEVRSPQDVLADRGVPLYAPGGIVSPVDAIRSRTDIGGLPSNRQLTGLVASAAPAQQPARRKSKAASKSKSSKAKSKSRAASKRSR
jgi:hypothetical protein